MDFPASEARNAASAAMSLGQPGSRTSGGPASEARRSLPYRRILGCLDTGVEVRGPAVADIDRAFAQVWGMAGRQIPAGELVSRDDIASAGDTAVRVLASVPSTAGLYRLGQLVAALEAEVQAVSVSGLRRRVALDGS
jgi:hypothetical protein